MRAVGVELFHTDGRTDMTKLLGAFRNFADARNHRRRMTCLDGVTHTDPQGPLWQHTCPFRQSEGLPHFFFWQREDCGLAGVGQDDTSETEMAFSYYDLYSVAVTLENYAKCSLFNKQIMLNVGYLTNKLR